VSAGPLTGRRIVVTRATRQSGGLRERLEQQGAEVLLLPTIEIAPPKSYEPLDGALRRAHDFAWLVVTSANAVRAIGERIRELALTVESLRHLRCAAVGPATADALRGLGLAVDVMPERYIGEALAAGLADCARGQRVLLVRAAVARDAVPEVLTSAGAAVTVVDAYRTMLPADAAERAKAIFGAGSLPDAVVFTSGSTVTHLLGVLRDAGLAFPPQVACVSIGPVTSAVLRESGLTVSAEAETASLGALVDACVQLFAHS
jgi:uroporphyrinogen-III synthase